MGNQQNKHSISENVDLSHFKLLRSIGRGSFGKVRIVENKMTKCKYALKYFSKEDLIRRKMCKNIVRERVMLENLNHPFVCNLRYAFQDDYNLYMGLDLMLGGDLRFHLHRRKFSEDELIFIAAELSSALGYLHSKNIVHRDIKPDNILLDEKGHVHITDFNIAAYIKPGHLLKSHSGTAQYMAPEMVSDKGYSYAADWWSLGILFYESIYGKTPFYEAIKKSKKKDCIVHNHIDFSSFTILEVSPLFFDFVKRLLIKNPSERLGKGSTGFFTIQKLPLFNGIDWELLEKKMLRPPFCPSSEKHNFDMTYDLEELLLEDYPLESLPTKRSKDPKKMSPEMLYLENSFTAYDFNEGPKARRYSDDMNPGASIIPDEQSIASADRDPDELDTLGALAPKAVTTPFDSKAYKRRSRSLMNLYEKVNEVIGKDELKNQSYKMQPKLTRAVKAEAEAKAKAKPVPDLRMSPGMNPTSCHLSKIDCNNLGPIYNDPPRVSTSSDRSGSNRTEISDKDPTNNNRSHIKKLFFGLPKKNTKKSMNFNSEHSDDFSAYKYM